MSGSWGVKPLFTTLNLNAWAFWIVIFVMVFAIFVLMRIIWMICSKKYKRDTISAIDLNEENSVQALYTSAIAPNYYQNGGNIVESINAMHDQNTNQYQKYLDMSSHKTKSDNFDGVDSVSKSYVFRATTPLRPLTPAYKANKVVANKDPLEFLSVPPGFVTALSYNSSRIERDTHTA